VRIEWVTTCRYAESHPGLGATLVGVGVDTTETTFPSTIDLWIAVYMAANHHEVGSDVVHHLTYTVQGPDMTDRDSDTLRFLLTEPTPGHRPGWDLHHLEALHIEFPVSEAGPHTISVALDSQVAKCAVLYVRDELRE